MATETTYQSKIINSIIEEGGTAITGKLKQGEADIQAGYPMRVIWQSGNMRVPMSKKILVKLTVEVKTPSNYTRVMRAVVETEGLYKIIDKTPLKKHEVLQIHKLNEVRKRGGFSLLAHSFKQVKEYMDAQQ